MKNTTVYKIAHKYDVEQYKINCYVPSELDLASMNEVLLALQLVHSKLPTDLISDDTIQKEHIARYWAKFRPNDGKVEITHDILYENVVPIDLYLNWDRGNKGKVQPLVDVMEKNCVGELMLQVELDTFEGNVINSSYYQNPDHEKAAAIKTLLSTQNMAGMTDLFGRPAYVSFAVA